MRLIPSLYCTLAFVAIAGCELQSADNFNSLPFERSDTVDRNYQAAYADIVSGARKCWGSSTIGLNSIDLDMQLYPDLGYGEVYHYANGLVFMPYALVRVERSNDQAHVSVKAGVQGGRETLFLEPPFKWADGIIECGRFWGEPDTPLDLDRKL